MLTRKWLSVGFVATFMAFSAVSAPVQESDVVSEKEATTQVFEWGTLITYYTADTVAIKDVLTAVAIINPHTEIHPPHVHAEEEYLMVIEGTGTWHLNGEDFAANAGDILYARPHEIHGIKNTGDTPLKFVVFKWGVRQTGG